MFKFRSIILPEDRPNSPPIGQFASDSDITAGDQPESCTLGMNPIWVSGLICSFKSAENFSSFV